MIYLAALVVLVAAAIWKFRKKPDQPDVTEILYVPSSPVPTPAPDPVPPPPEPKPVPVPVELTPAPPLPPKPPTMPKRLYDLAYSLLGVHLTLNESIPRIVGCAQAVSYVLNRFGVPGIPRKGISGTAELLTFLRNSKSFRAVDSYAPGRIIISPTGLGNGKCRGHVGICGERHIMSNNSETGKWDDHWLITEWTDFYHDYGGIPIYYFEPI